MELDEKDIQLLEILERNAKSPVQELSEKQGYQRVLFITELKN